MRIILIPLLAGLAALLIAGAWWYSRQDHFDYAAAFEQQDAVRPPMLLDISKIAAQSPETVQATLGAPLNCEDTLYSRRCRYQPAGTEVLYIDGKADWITVKYWPEVALAPEALQRLGVVITTPAEETERELIWREVSGYKELRLFGYDGQVAFARIKVLTP